MSNDASVLSHPRTVISGDYQEHAEVSAMEQAAQDLAYQWGWKDPTFDILKVALDTLEIQKRRRDYLSESADNTPLSDAEVEQYLVDQGIFEEDELRDLLSRKPANERSSVYLSAVNPQVSIVTDEYKAAIGSIPFYDLKTMIIEPIDDPNIIGEFDFFDMVMAKLDHDDSFLLLFGSYDQLKAFRSQGRDYKKRSELHKRYLNELKGEPQMGLSQSLGINQYIREMQSADDGNIATGKRSNHWSVNKNSANISREEKELSRLIDFCLQQDINDISLAPESSGAFRVTVRQFGDMIVPQNFGVIHPEIAQNAKRFLLSRSGANPGAVERIQNPKDGSITYSSAAGSTFMRLSFIPTNHRGDTSNSTSISIRLLPQGAQKITMSDLNLQPRLVEDARDALSFGSGLILVVGPTNSGKSTTIAGALNEHISMFGVKRKRLSLEDPIERFLDGIIQFEPGSGDEKDEDRFDRMLRAFKRHDPDLVWAGEVRDRETAELCVDTSSSGHMVLTTLHANDTVSGVDLLGRWVPATKTFQLIESLSLVISQRLVKTVCPECRTMREPNEDEVRTFKAYLKRLGEDKIVIPERVAEPSPTGCSKCRNGFNGMMPINESLPMTRAAKDAALRMVKGEYEHYQTLASKRTLTMLDSGLELVQRGDVQMLSILN